MSKPATVGHLYHVTETRTYFVCGLVERDGFLYFGEALHTSYRKRPLKLWRRVTRELVDEWVKEDSTLLIQWEMAHINENAA